MNLRVFSKSILLLVCVSFTSSAWAASTTHSASKSIKVLKSKTSKKLSKLAKESTEKSDEKTAQESVLWEVSLADRIWVASQDPKTHANLITLKLPLNKQKKFKPSAKQFSKLSAKARHTALVTPESPETTECQKTIRFSTEFGSKAICEKELGKNKYAKSIISDLKKL